MDISKILLDILIVLVAAKLAAEGAERIGVPAVVGEILAGILIGPSLLGLVGRGDEVLRTLGEIGVILLLLDVGMEMDLGELTKVGRASISVATIGVVAPMVLGLLAMEAFAGDDFNTSLFIGAALTATSVGITARVFGDLRAFNTTEARVVLGAAVADDVMGLVVLTVVVRLVTEGSVDALSVGSLVAVAIGFLVVGTLVGVKLVPGLFRGIARLSRSTGTMLGLAFAFALGFAELADKAQLAPIVGAFVAGLALGRTDQSERIRTELAPVGHLFIPVFFLSIGIDADISAFGKPSVLGIAAALLVVAVIGKLVASLGAAGTPGDKVLIGIGMLPRGEVGLIFATIGLADHVLDADIYASLLLVVLITTLATPQLLKLRYRAMQAKEREQLDAGTDERSGAPPDSWTQVVDGEIGLVARPPGSEALPLALQAAVAAAYARPATRLVSWLVAAAEDGSVAARSDPWSAEDRELLLDVIERGNARSWRFLDASGVIDAALPPLGRALRARARDPLLVDVEGAYRFPSLGVLRRLDGDDPVAQEAQLLDHPDRLLLGLLLAEALDAAADPVGDARTVTTRLGMDEAGRDAVTGLVQDRYLLWAASRRSRGTEEGTVRQLAAHLGSVDRARALYVLSELLGAEREPWERARLRALYELLSLTLAGEEADAVRRDLAAERRRAAVPLAGSSAAVSRVIAAPAGYVLREPPAQVAAHAALLDPLPGRGRLRVHVDQSVAGSWDVQFVARDRHGLLAASARALSDAGLDVRRALLATWPDGASLQSFRVAGGDRPDADALAGAAAAALARPPGSAPVEGVSLELDEHASPWHAVCEVSAPEQPGLLAAVATAFAAAGIDVRAATLTSHDGRALDTFDLVGRDGRTVSPEEQERVEELLASGVAPKTRRRGRRGRAAPDPSDTEVAVPG